MKGYCKSNKGNQTTEERERWRNVIYASFNNYLLFWSGPAPAPAALPLQAFLDYFWTETDRGGKISASRLTSQDAKTHSGRALWGK